MKVETTIIEGFENNNSYDEPCILVDFYELWDIPERFILKKVWDESERMEPWPGLTLFQSKINQPHVVWQIKREENYQLGLYCAINNRIQEIQEGYLDTLDPDRGDEMRGLMDLLSQMMLYMESNWDKE